MMSPPETPSSPSPPRSRLGRIVRLGFPVLLLPLGFAGTLAYQAFAKPTGVAAQSESPIEAHASIPAMIAKADGHDSAHEAVPTHGEKPHAPAGGHDATHKATAAHVENPHVLPKDDIAVADAAIGRSEWREALAALDSAGAPHSFARYFRVGLGREALGDGARAGAAYQLALEYALTPPERSFAQFGLARCDRADKSWDAAAVRLRAILLTSGHPGCRAARVAEDALTLLAEIDVARLGPSPKPDPLSPRSVASPDWSEPAQHHLVKLVTSRIVRPAPEPGVRAEPRPAGGHLITAYRTGTTVTAVLTEIATACGRSITIPSSARARFDAVTLDLDVRSLPSRGFLAALVGSHGFAVTETDGRLDVAAVSPPNTDADRRTIASESLTRALDLDPNNAAVKLANGNVAFGAGLWRVAAGWYQNVLNDPFDSSSLTVAAYNLGLVRLLESQPRAARAAFLTVVDAAVSERWGERGRWWVARADLDAGEIDAARTGFRSIRTASDPAVRSAAGLGLAACHLYDGKSENVRDALRDGRVASDEGHERLRDVWVTWEQYKTTPTAGRANRLRRASLAVPDETLLGPVGVWLVGQARKEIGDVSAMAGLYERESAHVRGALGERMTLAVADAMDGADITSGARSRYLSLASSADPAVRDHARLALAEIDLSLGQPAASLKYLGRVADLPADERERALRVKARAYESLGKFREAAACYSGQDPIE